MLTSKNIFKVGPEKAYNLIKQYSSIDGIATETQLDVSVLKHIRVRELITAVPDETKIPFCKIPDFNKLDNFLFENNSKVDISGLKKAFEQHELSFD